MWSNKICLNKKNQLKNKKKKFIILFFFSSGPNMGKDGGFLTPKAIANRIKAKGLQKLKFYCQMCEKQCRDANGFKCHVQSESHRRQMEIVAANQGKFIQNFSKQFEKGFMDIVRTRYRKKKVRANHVYNEYIQDREHVHMNSTTWSTLTEFC